MDLSSYRDAIETIQRFINGESDAWEWDDFISIKSPDTFLNAIRIACSQTRDVFPPLREGDYTSDVGKEVLKDLLEILKKAVAGRKGG